MHQKVGGIKAKDVALKPQQLQEKDRYTPREAHGSCNHHGQTVWTVVLHKRVELVMVRLTYVLSGVRKGSATGYGGYDN